MKKFWDFQFKKETQLLPLFLNQSFRGVAVSLLSLFSAVYIYKTFSSLTGQENLGLLAVFSFFLFLNVFKFIFFLLAEELSLKLGLKKMVYLGLFCLFLGVFSLLFSLKQPVWIFLTPLFWGASVGLYWFGRHGLVIKQGREEDFGKQLGLANALVVIFLLGVPFLGGLLINFAGYRALFIASLCFLFLAALILKSTKDEKTHTDTNLTEVLGLFRTHKRMLVAYMGDAAGTTIYGVAIPLYLFFILKRELSLGEFFSLSMVLVALIDLMIGRWIDIKGKSQVIGFGAILSFLVWLGRFFTVEIGLLLIFDILDRITTGMTGIPLSVLSYEKALDGHSTGRAVLFREIAISFGSVFACFLLILLALAGIDLKYSFLAAAAFCLLPLTILRHEEKQD